jgi:uncharacterized membrane protein YidH (DUF202 family)
MSAEVLAAIELPAPYADLAGQVAPEARDALADALATGADAELALLRAGISAEVLLQALAARHGLEATAYDERLSVPPELVAEIDRDMLAHGRWFPLGIAASGAVVIAAHDPADELTTQDVARHYPGREIIWRVALGRDIRWFVEDFLKRASGGQIGVVRTQLAFWRNTMAHWRTKLACYRTDMARARTSLNIFRWGLGLVTLGNSLLRAQKLGANPAVYWVVIGLGLAVAGTSLSTYLKARGKGVAPPPVQTLVEVTAATTEFLEQFHYIPGGHSCATEAPPAKPTMLGRLGDLLCQHSTILDTGSGFRERIHLAQERNVLAAQRTVCACYRTVAARARTGLSLLRTGVTLSCLGLGLIHYFGVSMFTVFDAALILAGLLMIGEGAAWYWPVRQEPAQTPRCIDWGGDEN